MRQETPKSVLGNRVRAQTPPPEKHVTAKAILSVFRARLEDQSFAIG